ncbi:MAG: hypothetical protein QOG72_3076 [Sphingomonadales bacterium]|jgi:hypothetical protein|nr:hypothetical protein [Sphingomonadales bacterium]
MSRLSNTRKLTILAQDPAVRLGGRLTFAEVDVPAEILASGPTGYRVKVVDYDASSRLLYQDKIDHEPVNGEFKDPFARAPEEDDPQYEQRLLGNPNFHAQNVYAIVMRTLARFEFALGRRVAWSFGGHQLNVAPHAFSEANAFYSEEDKGLFFGYFDGITGRVFTCLSHDVVAHETTHALLDGLRTGFTELSGPDQSAFHEAFADVVALLSIFSLPQIVAALLDSDFRPPREGSEVRLIDGRRLEPKALRETSLMALAEQFGREIQNVHGDALRRSVMIEPARDVLSRMEYQEAHARGEVLAAAMMRTFLDLWDRRIRELGTFGDNQYNLDMVIEEGAKAADHLLTMAIRALDYCPPVDIDFRAFLAAALTADAELIPGDKYGYRDSLREAFASYGIDPPEEGCLAADGTWCPFDRTVPISYASTNFESMLRDKEEVFRFIWENRVALGIEVRGVIEVESVRPSVRQGLDGFFLKETIVTYIQRADLFGAEVGAILSCDRPEGLPTTQRITAFGGGVLVFDQYGQIKYHITHRLNDAKRQFARLEYLWETGQTNAGLRGARDRFAGLHRARAED